MLEHTYQHKAMMPAPPISTLHREGAVAWESMFGKCNTPALYCCWASFKKILVPRCDALFIYWYGARRNSRRIYDRQTAGVRRAVSLPDARHRTATLDDGRDSSQVCAVLSATFIRKPLSNKVHLMRRRYPRCTPRCPRLRVAQSVTLNSIQVPTDGDAGWRRNDVGGTGAVIDAKVRWRKTGTPHRWMKTATPAKNCSHQADFPQAADRRLAFAIGGPVAIFAMLDEWFPR